MDVFTNVPPTTAEKWMARLRRFFRWLTKPQVVLIPGHVAFDVCNGHHSFIPTG